MKKNKKNNLAVALKYNIGDNAPKVIAKGKGLVAEQIIKKGKQEAVEIHEDKDLAKNLMDIEIGQEIPENLYTTVASILAFVYDLDNKEGEHE